MRQRSFDRKIITFMLIQPQIIESISVTRYLKQIVGQL